MRSRSHTALNGITVPGDLTEPSRFPNRPWHDSRWQTEGVCHGPRYSGADGLHRRRGSPVCPASERRCAGATAVSDCGRARGGLAGRGGEDWHVADELLQACRTRLVGAAAPVAYKQGEDLNLRVESLPICVTHSIALVVSECLAALRPRTLLLAVTDRGD